MLSELLMKMYGAGLMEIDTHPWTIRASHPIALPSVNSPASRRRRRHA